MKYFTVIAFMLLISIALLIIFLDIGNSSGNESGAGEIWWTSVSEIDVIYRDLNRDK